MNNDKVETSRPDLLHQVSNARDLVRILGTRLSAADWSETGSGKSRTFLRVIRELRRPSLLVGPKISATAMRRAGDETGTGFSFANWEMVRTGRTPFGCWEKAPVSAAAAKKRLGTAGEAIRAAALAGRQLRPSEVAALMKGTTKRTGTFRWAPEIGFIVFDEAHRAKAPDSQQAMLLAAAVDQGIPHLIVSATPPADPTELKAIGYSMGLHGWDDWFHWAQRNGCYRLPVGGLHFTTNPVARQAAIGRISEAWGANCVRTTLREVYPDNPLVVLPELYDVPEEELIRALTEEAVRHLADIEARIGGGQAVTAYQKVCQQIELLKVPVLVELANNGRAAGRTIHIFVNYTETIEELRRHLPDFEIISGDAPFNKPSYRQRVMDDAQWGLIPGCILNCAAGSESISLQDLTGEHPPESLICVPDSVERFVQVMGRTDRFGGKSIPIARLVLAAGSEEKRYKRLMLKRDSLKRLLTREDLSIGC